MSFVVDAAVIGIPHEEDGEQAMALVVKDPKDDLTETEALEYVHGKDFKFLILFFLLTQLLISVIDLRI